MNEPILIYCTEKITGICIKCFCCDSVYDIVICGNNPTLLQDITVILDTDERLNSTRIDDYRVLMYSSKNEEEAMTVLHKIKEDILTWQDIA